MQIQLDSEMLKGVVAEALMQSLDQQKREALVKGAIQHLLSPSETGGYYGRKTSPIQDAFNRAVSDVAQSIALEMMSKDAEVGAKVRALLAEALVRVFEENREQTVQKVADAITAGLAYRER